MATQAGRQTAVHAMKILIGLFLVAIAIMNFAEQRNGVGLLSTLHAIMLAMSALATPGPRLADFARLVRDGFNKCDRYARILLIVIAIGGNFLIMDVFYDPNFLWEWLEKIVKNFSFAIVCCAVSLYFGAFISNRVVEVLVVDKDDFVKRYDVMLYLSLSLFMISAFPFSYYLLAPEELSSSLFDRLIHGGEYRKLSATFFLSFLLWCICFTGCVASRYFEVVWRIRFNGTHQRGATNPTGAERAAQ